MTTTSKKVLLLIKRATNCSCGILSLNITPPLLKDIFFFIYRWHYIDSIVFLADNMDLADNTLFLLITWYFRNHIWNLKNHMWVARQARGAERRPERVAKRRMVAGADLRGPDGPPTSDFSNSRYGFENIMLLSKNLCYSAKSMLICQKQRCYTYDSIVYAPFVTLFTFLIIFIFWS